MALDADALVTPPSIAKTASIATNGRSWGEIGATGQRSYTLPLPTLNARTLNPELQLVYDGNAGNGKCGLGWDLPLPAISRKTSKGVPKYEATDVMQADGTDLRPELTARGRIKATRRTRGKGKNARKFSVMRYIPRLESTFDRYEFWTPDTGHPFWVVSRADGSQHCYGNSPESCIYDPEDPTRIAVWLLVEIRNTVGENIYFEYKSDDTDADLRFDYRAQRYLRQVCYCNKTASTDLYCLDHAQPELLDWLFRLIVDYGERVTRREAVPSFLAAEDKWLPRSDPFRSHRFGFELGTRRLCRQFLLFNHIGPEPTLVNRLLLEHEPTLHGYNHLKAAHYMSYDATGRVKHMPPLEYFYEALILDTTPKPFLQLDHMPGLNDGQPYHCVDLYGEGLPGFLCQYDGAWYYREPLRGAPGSDEIVYGPWTLLPLIPNADSSKTVVQILTDLTGDGRLDWVVAQPGGSGYYTLNPDGTWSLFKPFSRFPVEFFHQLTRMGDLSGAGLDDLALIGPNSVRVYANLREKGFAPGKDVPHSPDRLPLFSDARSELVSFSGMGASGMELCRIRHDEIRCWASLGHSRFGEGFKLSDLPFDYGEFDADRVRIADLDGSGAPAFIYLSSDYFEIWFNQGGNGLVSTPVRVPWPDGIRYDNLCQVTFADLRGIGCASLLFTKPHMTPQHWVYHFVSERPYLLTGCNNNMGYSATLQHRSSAQFWLDEKHLELMARRRPVCLLPFPQMVLHWLRQDDEITGNYLMQFHEYFEGYYDGYEREFRGFGKVCQTDSELEPGKAESGHTAPMRVTHWFHTGRSIDLVLKGTCELDDEITPLGPTAISTFDAKGRKERVRKRRKADDHREIAYALAGRPLRTEVCQADDPAPARLFSLSESRYRVRVVKDNPSSVLVLELETRSHQYEKFMDDPRCEHTVNLERDEYGHLTHGFTVACARRRIETDKPPFDREDQMRAWEDSHDEQQRSFYLTETLAGFTHLTTEGHWLLGLPERQRGNAMKLPKGALPGGLRAADISFENFDRYKDSAEWTAARELTSLAQHTYLEAAGKILYPPRQGPTEQAVFDKKALAAYDDVPIVIRDELTKIGYSPMKLFFPEDPAQDLLQNLWSAQSGFFTYADASGFHHVTEVQQTASHGVTHITWDADHLLTIAITLPDGCVTSVKYDMHTLQPLSITDPNENIQEVLYDAGSQPMVLSFHGSEEGLPAGFVPLSAYPPQSDLSVEYALAHPKTVVASAASAVRTELFSWMPVLSRKTLSRKRKEWIAKGLILPDGHIRASAPRWLNQRKKRTASEQTLLRIIRTAPRQPVHSLRLVADRYPNDPLQLIQMIIAYFDGFGRELQSKQLVPPGDAFVATPEDNLATGADGKPIELPAIQRWRVQSRVEYNHKGETIRVYRPYFLNTHRCINDSAMRQHGYHDRMFYDAPGRPIQTINALGHLAFDVLHPWFKLSYDFNDTDDSLLARPAKRPAPARPAKRIKS
ncbi:SpvB/TcaC N-terminal domain-containing protein [Pseudomonas kribbensis]|uniref:Toxin n=1 Tax=Pseudomonas kribbensis TaxID=1628086 RepID=A0A4Y8VBN2_9PSED|nr:SpvB/TcaC N-terminal domain-containing protein [Pseudomonas kribbensis]TFH78272.1 toxin [Pseudomonas kribbensis]